MTNPFRTYRYYVDNTDPLRNCASLLPAKGTFIFPMAASEDINGIQSATTVQGIMVFYATDPTHE